MLTRARASGHDAARRGTEPAPGHIRVTGEHQSFE